MASHWILIAALASSLLVFVAIIIILALCFVMRRQLEYIYGFNKIIQILRGKDDEIKNAKEELQLSVDQMQDPRFITSHSLNRWVGKSNLVVEEIGSILGEVGKVRWWNVKSRFLLGKRAREEIENVRRLLSQYENFNDITMFNPRSGPQASDQHYILIRPIM